MTYKERKEKARQKAIGWQHEMSERDLSYKELIWYQQDFEKLARKYGLIREFRENAII
jgi:hypothetical protein